MSKQCCRETSTGDDLFPTGEDRRSRIADLARQLRKAQELGQRAWVAVGRLVRERDEAQAQLWESEAAQERLLKELELKEEELRVGREDFSPEAWEETLQRAERAEAAQEGLRSALETHACRDRPRGCTCTHALSSPGTGLRAALKAGYEAWARIALAIRTGVDPATANGPPGNAAFFTKDELIAYVGSEAATALELLELYKGGSDG